MVATAAHSTSARTGRSRVRPTSPSVTIAVRAARAESAVHHHQGTADPGTVSLRTQRSRANTG